MMKSITKNFSKPQGMLGSLLLGTMNKGHDKITKWALSKINLTEENTVLDVGCGGGNAIFLMSQMAKQVYGADYSEVSVNKSCKTNAKAIALGQVQIVQASVSSLPFPDEKFDVVTAFETIYFWPDLSHDFKEVLRVLRPGGTFLVVFQTGSTQEQSRKTEQSIENMKVYQPEQISSALKEAGFTDVSIETGVSQNGWKDFCAIAKK